jgi:hypothetical protein
MGKHIKIPYSEWKDVLFRLFLDYYIKRKKAKEMSSEYEEEFNMGMTPEEVLEYFLSNEKRINDIKNMNI